MGAVIAWVATKVGATLAPIVVWGLIGIAAVGISATLWQTQVRGPYIRQGESNRDPEVKKLTLERDQVKAEVTAVRVELGKTTAERDSLLAANEKLGADVTTLRGTVGEQTAAIRRYQGTLAATKAAVEAAKAAYARLEQDATAKIASLTAQAKGAALTAADAVAILNDLADYAHAP